MPIVAALDHRAADYDRGAVIDTNNLVVIRYGFVGGGVGLYAIEIF